MTETLHWLSQPAPGQALRQLLTSGALAKLLPEVEALYGVPQRAEHHPEIDTGIHIELCLDAAHRLGASFSARVAVLLHDLGKAVTDSAKWPAHVDHESLGVPLVERVAARLGLDEYTRSLCLLVCDKHLHMHRAFDMRAQSVIALLSETGLLHDDHLLRDFSFACEADARGRLGFEDRHYGQPAFLHGCAEALRELPLGEDLVPQTRAWQERHAARLFAVRQVRRQCLDTAAPAQTTAC